MELKTVNAEKVRRSEDEGVAEVPTQSLAEIVREATEGKGTIIGDERGLPTPERVQPAQ